MVSICTFNDTTVFNFKTSISINYLIIATFERFIVVKLPIVDIWARVLSEGAALRVALGPIGSTRASISLHFRASRASDFCAAELAFFFPLGLSQRGALVCALR